MGLRLRLEEKTMTKIDVVSGFLGAGKTTLIKKLLKEALDGSKTVLIESIRGVGYQLVHRPEEPA